MTTVLKCLLATLLYVSVVMAYQSCGDKKVDEEAASNRENLEMVSDGSMTEDEYMNDDQ